LKWTGQAGPGLDL